MKISRITVYQVDLPMKEGAYSWSMQSFSAFDSTIVAIETDEGITGYGETCPLGPSYLAAYAECARTGIAKIAPDLIGLDPTELDRVNDRMDQLLKGHPYVKSALDMACWDMAISTPSTFHFQSSAFHDYHTISIADGGPAVEKGFMQISDAPGLGVEPIMDVLGDPVFRTGASA